MLDLVLRVGSIAAVSCLGWTTLEVSRQQPVPEPPPAVVRPVSSQPVPVSQWADPAYMTELDPFYTPELSAPRPATKWVWARVTACSPHDPKDVEYYRKHGYAGATYNIAADYRVFPKGTRIRVPGYMDTSYPDRFWVVDSPGGQVIRNSTARGVVHIDVKFNTLHSVMQWGSKYMWIEVAE